MDALLGTRHAVGASKANGSAMPDEFRPWGMTHPRIAVATCEMSRAPGAKLIRYDIHAHESRPKGMTHPDWETTLPRIT